MTLKFDGWPRKTTGHFFYTTSSFVHHFKSIGEFKLESGNAQFGLKLMIFVLCDLEIWWMTLKNNRAPLLYHIKFRASFQIHQWSQTCVTVRKRPIRIKIGDFLLRVTLKFYGWPWKTIGHLFYTTLSSVLFFVLCDLKIWWMTLKNNRAPLLCHFKLWASFHSHQSIRTGAAVWKRPIWVKINVFLAMWPWNLTDDVEKQ